MELYLQKGAPERMEERLEKEQRCYELLESLGIAFDRVDHEPAENMEVCQSIETVLGAPICKNLFLCNRQQTQFHLLLMPGDKPFRTKELSAQIGSARLSFAGADKMLEYLDILPGAVSVMGLMNDRENNVQLLIDEDVLKGEYVGCHPCVNTSSLRLKTADVIEIFLPAVHHTYQTVRLIGGEPL